MPTTPLPSILERTPRDLETRARAYLDRDPIHPEVERRSPPLPPSRARSRAKHHRLELWGGLFAISAGTGVALGFGGGRRSLAAGGIAALALGALRWQLARWFEPTPSYEVIAHVGGLELRRYPACVEVRTGLVHRDIEAAIDAGFGRLACYVYGANARREDVEHATPILTEMRDGAYSTAFVVLDRARAMLPEPDDPRVELRDVPVRDLAVLGFRGRCTAAILAQREHELLVRLVATGLAARGSVAFACYDSPATLPMLRRNELWIELV